MNMSVTDRLADESSCSENKETVFRIAVVGCGPRGLYCLDSLSRSLTQKNWSRPITVTIFEPSAFPGAGNVYATDQPHFLRMNFAAKHVNAWREQDLHGSDAVTLVEWLEQNRPDIADPEAYVPRAVVGEYLTACFHRVMKSLSEIASVRVCSERVNDIEEAGDIWRLVTSTETYRVDEVMLTVGHEGWRPSACSVPVSDTAHIDQVFPVQRQLDRKRILAGQRVAVRGFGLTWIDAALAMTEGREGTFQFKNLGCSYHSSGCEPSLLLPFSRTGRPMLAKPIESRMRLPTALSDIWKAGRQRLNCIARPIDRASFYEHVWGEFVKTTATALRCVDGSTQSVRGSTIDEIKQWFVAWRTGRFDAKKVVTTLRQSVDVATGVTQPDIAWAVGETWRRLYPSLVERISHGGLADDAWPDFLQLANEMERLAFGPPAENVSRILALGECGLIDFNFVSGSQLKSSAGNLILDGDQSTTPVDIFINAVIASPVEWNGKGVLAQLMANQIVRQMNFYTGIEVDEQARPRNMFSNKKHGLAIIGRATEGCILGNDTLSRKLHPHIDNWAGSVAARLLDCPLTRGVQ